jgi:hypothetical protein
MTDQDRMGPGEDGHGPVEEMSQNGTSNPLTRIRDAYTLAATDEHAEGEVEELMIRHFIETLAGIALSVASRRIGEKESTR